jgi:hypothetical protein
VLKNARDGGDAFSRNTATEICQRHFAREPTSEERLMVRASTRLSIATPNNGGPSQYAVVAEIANHAPSFKVTLVTIELEFFKEPLQKVPDQFPIETLTWTLDADVSPNGFQEVEGGFENAAAPSRNFKVVRAEASQIVPFGPEKAR